MVARARKSRPGAQRVWRNNYKLKRHRDVADNLKAMATAEITAIDERVEVLVAAYDQLLLKLVLRRHAPRHRCDRWRAAGRS